jgi:hypothetical protein
MVKILDQELTTSLEFGEEHTPESIIWNTSPAKRFTIEISQTFPWGQSL